MILAPRRKELATRTTLAILSVIPLIAAIVAPLGCSSTRELSPSTIANVHGVIRDRDGIGVAGISVCFDPADDGRSTSTCAPTDRNGEYRLRVRKGPYFWMLFSWRVRVPTVGRDTVILTERDQRLDYRCGGFKVEGRVLGPDGIPMKAGSVDVFGGVDPISRYEIDVRGTIEDGRYRVFLPASTYWFRANPRPDRYPQIEGGPKVPISADTTINLIASGHLVAGRATLGRLGSLRGAEVEAHGKSVDGLDVSAYDRTRGDGRFDLYLPKGDYGILVKPGPSNRNISLGVFDFTVDGPRKLAVNLGRVVWRGTVRDSITRAPLRGVYVIAAMPRGSVILVSKSDGRGRFMFVPNEGWEYGLMAQVNDPTFVERRIGGTVANNDSTFDFYVGNIRASSAASP